MITWWQSTRAKTNHRKNRCPPSSLSLHHGGHLSPTSLPPSGTNPWQPPRLPPNSECPPGWPAPTPNGKVSPANVSGYRATTPESSTKHFSTCPALHWHPVDT